jgi:hypothetical protein
MGGRHPCGIKGRESRRQDERSHLIGQNLSLLIKIDGFGFTGSCTLLALLSIQEQAIMRINHIGRRGRLSIRNVDCLPIGKILIVRVRGGYRAIRGTYPACSAFVFIHVAGSFENFHREVPNIP